MRFLFFVLISLPAFISVVRAEVQNSDALEPQNPVALCDRFIKPTDQKDCQKKAAKMDLDWYASSVCGLMQDDHEVMTCWQKIQGKQFSVQALEKCRDASMKDSDRLSCLGGGASSRSPASTSKSGVYQKLGK